MTRADREERQVPRVQPFVAPCRILEPAQKRQGYVTDLSTRGAQVAMATEPPEVGARVTLEIRLGGRVASLRLEATVIWHKPVATPPGFAFGLTFQELSERQFEILDSVLAEVRRRADALS
jgi:hypothetical protein